MAPSSNKVPSYASQFKYVDLSFPFENVLHVQLKRPPVNAFNEEFWREYGTAFDQIGQDPTVRVVVLSSAVDKAFSAGVDLSDLLALPRHEDIGRRALLTPAVHGVAFGLALDALGAVDVRWAAEDVAFSIREVDVGLAADIGTLARFPKLVGDLSWLYEVAFSGRVFGAQEALQFGLVSRVVPGSREKVVKAALEFAEGIARKSPVAVSGVKRFIAHALDHSVDAALEYQATWGAFALQAKDLSESAAAAKRKQKIEYENLGVLERRKAKL
ncbi:ClpP/crotonase-like domain-containing protein [Multifurca ochricompacta]|uniref:ClpP/crotonase-like domain-containing protein n=1 Tax=Multifurca ochricompacta TaxID=376703 RepID=A0AAD4M2D9_9AGAM|nr:ClpP/crotonase-like domain-containing protein [Multifurca ochricompacta]